MTTKKAIKPAKKTTKPTKTTKAKAPEVVEDLQPVPLMLLNSRDEYTIGH